jgi:hypothetical protein
MTLRDARTWFPGLRPWARSMMLVLIFVYGWAVALPQVYAMICRVCPALDIQAYWPER